MEDIIKELIKLAVEMIVVKGIETALGIGGTGGGGGDPRHAVPHARHSRLRQRNRLRAAGRAGAGAPGRDDRSGQPVTDGYGGSVTQNHTWNITAGPNADPREIARQVAKIWETTGRFAPAGVLTDNGGRRACPQNQR